MTGGNESGDDGKVLKPAPGEVIPTGGDKSSEKTIGSMTARGNEGDGKKRPLLYGSAGEALQTVNSEYSYWTGRLTEASTQMCYAVIGADWVVFGSVNGILNNIWAKWSLSLVLVALGISILGAWRLSEALRKQVEHGESSEEGWQSEYEAYLKKRGAWPFTKEMENIGKWMRLVKAGCTIVAGAFVIIGAIRM